MARKQNDQPETKFIAGVPVLNYNLAYQGKANLAELGENAKEDWVVVGKPGTSDTQINAACQTHGAGCALAGHPSKGGVAFFKIRATEEELKVVLQAAGGLAKFAEPDLAMSTLPDMPSVQSEASWGLTRIGAPLRATTGVGVHVYVCDTGIRATHQDFGGRAISALDMSSGSLKECNGALNCGADAQGHGTHCAGTVGGRTFGVAPGAWLHSVKVLSDSGSGSWSWSYSALDWLATSGERPAVASMSLGGSGTQNAMKEAVDTAVAAGVTVVVAGGNDNSDACGFSPAFVPKAITVGSTTSTDARSYFSNYGSCTDIWAPGSDITSAAFDSDTGSKTMSGTSMACPHVSGGSALLLESSPELLSADIISTLLDNAISNAITDLKPGDVNKLLYVGAGGPPPTPAPVPTPAPPPTGCPSSTSTGPDSDGDCRCNSGLTCYQNGSRSCDYSYTGRYGWQSTRWFLDTCGSACECK
jgi:serine protease